ncbi:MAG: polysaccharide deacetylase family protein [Pirellulales bacterium]|nr:polysaccharide deacetylase family protein [Pirellulales bacterium]
MNRNIGKVGTIAAALGWLSLAVFATPSQAEQTWAERLGFPAGKKVLILYADQAGMTYETSAAAETALKQNQVQSVGNMMPAPWGLDFAQRADDLEKYDVGLSLTLTSEYENYRWKPVLPAGEVPSLVDSNSYLWRTLTQFTASATSDDTDREVQAQIQRARAAGFEPSHLTPHMGALVYRPDLMAVYLGVAHKHWIPAIVVELTPQRLAEFQQKGFPLTPSIVGMISKYPLPKLDDLKFSPTADNYEGKRNALMKLIQSLSPGLTQIVFRPAIEGGGLKRIDPHWQQRLWDNQLLSDSKLQEFYQSQSVIFTNWKEIMRRFEGAVQRPSEEP